MDPSFSVSNDPHHPPPFTAFPPFTNSNSFAAPQYPFYAGAVNSSAVAPPNNNQFFQPPPPAPLHPSVNHPPYSEMICTAIAALNEPDGSSKQAISRYIERIYTGIPRAHGALLTHHLKTMKNSGVLVMVKKSYKFAPTPTSIAVAAAAGLEPPRSDFNNTVNENLGLPDPAATTTPQTQKRGRGRPPKAKPDVQATDVQTNGKPSWKQNELPVSRPEEQMQLLPQPQAQQPQAQPQLLPQPQAQPQLLIKRPRGRPRKDGALQTVKASVSGGAEIAKRRGRPPSGRAAGRERKPALVSAPASVFPYVANGGVRRRGRPKRIEACASSVAPTPPNAESGGEQVAVVVAKRGRGRPPKIGGVIRKPMKQKRGYRRTGKPLGRPRKTAASKGASGQQDISYGELKKKFELFQEKAKEIVNVLKAEVGGSGNQAVVQAIHELEELTVTKTETSEEPPSHMEELQPDEQHPENEPQREGEGQAQTEAEAMQEALF